MKFIAVLLGAALLSMGTLHAQSATTVFRGRPEVKISEGGVERTPQQITPATAINLESVVSKIEDRYYWASRENTQLVRVDGGGAFVTYVALNGSGYVRVIKPEFKTAASSMSDTEARFDYIEHVLVGLRTVTYYGRVRP